MLIYVHGLAEFSRFAISCVYMIKVLFLYSEIRKMQQTSFTFVVDNFIVMKYSYFTRYPLEIYVVLKFMSSCSFLKGIAHVVPLLMFYNQNQFLPKSLYRKYLSEILGVLYITFCR